MQHVFIVNPVAGKGRFMSLAKEIKEKVYNQKMNALLHKTVAIGDGEEFVRSYCESHADEGKLIRFYACGGDGTLNEVINGAYGFDNVEVACIPIGTGNDFVRNFPDAGDFKSLDAQINGTAQDIDLIRYCGFVDGIYTDRFCANMFNIGFDCNVVDRTAQLKQYPLVKGSFAYLLGVANILIKKEGANLRIEFEDGTVRDGEILLAAIANGCFCGGGVKGIPYATLDDGEMDVSIIDVTTRRNFIRLFPKYSKGTHLEADPVPDIFDYRKSRKLKITPNDGHMKFCVDGEIVTATEIEFEIAPKAIRFAVPCR